MVNFHDFCEHVVHIMQEWHQQNGSHPSRVTPKMKHWQNQLCHNYGEESKAYSNQRNTESRKKQLSMAVNLCGVLLVLPPSPHQLHSSLEDNSLRSQCETLSQVTSEAEQALQSIMYVGFNLSGDHLKYCHKVLVPVSPNLELTQARKVAFLKNFTRRTKQSQTPVTKDYSWDIQQTTKVWKKKLGGVSLKKQTNSESKAPMVIRKFRRLQARIW